MNTHQSSPTDKKSIQALLKNAVPGLILLLGFVSIALFYDFDMRLLAGGVILIGLLSNVFTWCMGLVGFLPWIGPTLVKVLHLPFVWLLNGIGYILSFIAIRTGHGDAVFNYRLITIVFLSGAVTGYMIAILLS